MKVGILFGGRSREREISFAGGRTVYDNLDKSLFEAVPIFVDSFGNFTLLDWQYVYKSSKTTDEFYANLTLFDICSLLLEFTTYLESYNITQQEFVSDKYPTPSYEVSKPQFPQFSKMFVTSKHLLYNMYVYNMIHMDAV